MKDEQITQGNGGNMQPESKENAKTKSVLGYIHDLVYLLVALMAVFLIFFRVVVVSGPSMQNTLLDGDNLLLISRILYAKPTRGDIIVAAKDSYGNGTPIIKRIIATEGQVVDIDFETGTVMVDGEVLDEPYIKNLTTSFEGVVFPLRVGDGCVFVLGDNRMNSKDSRDPVIGLIDTREIVGKAVLLYLPGTDKGRVERDFSRIGVLH